MITRDTYENINHTGILPWALIFVPAFCGKTKDRGVLHKRVLWNVLKHRADNVAEHWRDV